MSAFLEDLHVWCSKLSISFRLFIIKPLDLVPYLRGMYLEVCPSLC